MEKYSETDKRIARSVAIKAAVDASKEAHTTDDIIAIAKKFEKYVLEG